MALIERREVLCRQWEGLRSRADRLAARIAGLDADIVEADTPTT